MSRVRELFAFSVERNDIKWKSLIKSQQCRFSGKRCFKVRKSQADVSIGTCTVQYGADNKDVIICPNRLLERKQIFTDSVGISKLLGLNADANIGFEEIAKILESKISDATVFSVA